MTMMFSKKAWWSALPIALVTICCYVGAGCDDHDHDDGDHSHADGGGGHTSPYPACNEITQACHEVDTGEETPIHACHDSAHAAKSEADCTPIKENCLKICAEAKVDAGGASDGGGAGDGGDDGDAGQNDQ